MTLKMIKAFSDAYGPYIFGVVSLLIIWTMIVQPQMEQNKIDYDEFTRAADIMQDTAETLHRTADVMDRTAERLERIEARTTVNR